MKELKEKNIKWWLGLTSGVLLFSIIATFAYMKTSFLFKGVQLEAKIERNDNSSVATITGKAANATFVSLNGREIYINENGDFSEPIALMPGFSVITINTQDKFGKEKEKKFQVIYKENAPSVAFNK